MAITAAMDRQLRAPRIKTHRRDGYGRQMPKRYSPGDYLATTMTLRSPLIRPAHPMTSWRGSA
jgi:hypothetical protein